MSINYFLFLSVSTTRLFYCLFSFFTLLSCEDLCREGEDFLGCSGHQLSMMALDLHCLELIGKLCLSIIWSFYCNTFKVLMSEFLSFCYVSFCGLFLWEIVTFFIKMCSWIGRVRFTLDLTTCH